MGAAPCLLLFLRAGLLAAAWIAHASEPAFLWGARSGFRRLNVWVETLLTSMKLIIALMVLEVKRLSGTRKIFRKRLILLSKLAHVSPHIAHHPLGVLPLFSHSSTPAKAVLNTAQTVRW
ncbi:hypothetical protein [Massilia endophytica]|uniref:hypothetical protein n=1 Tax=Massilia endophytica TaxID=2899220 RepID=UPI001E488F80|nr:hypothetical protein [Massilia endophytica]UGQ45260.1 hypothetical protein LSQ66_15850 [Massilia endophytica]